MMVVFCMLGWMGGDFVIEIKDRIRMFLFFIILSSLFREFLFFIFKILGFVNLSVDCWKGNFFIRGYSRVLLNF